MKRFQLLKLLPIVAVIFAAACTDATTSPVTSNRLLVPDGPALAPGEAPPPPVETATVVCAGGTCVVVYGKYDATGAGAAAAVAAAGLLGPTPDALAPDGSGVCDFPGKAWLNFSKHKKKDLQFFPDVKVDGSARIDCKDLAAFGKGTIQFSDVVVLLDKVRTFHNTGVCSAELMPCATFTSDAMIGDELVPDGAAGTAINREFFDTHDCGYYQPGGDEGGAEPPPIVYCSGIGD